MFTVYDKLILGHGAQVLEQQNYIFNELAISAIYLPVHRTENYQVELEVSRKEAERVIRTTERICL